MPGLWVLDMRVTAKVISDAIRAYEAGESALSIQQRTGLLNQTFYLNLRKRGILTHQAKRSDRSCRCGASLVGKPLSAIYCSPACSAKYRRQDARDALLASGGMTYCKNPACRRELFGTGRKSFCCLACKRAFVKSRNEELKAAAGKSIIILSNKHGLHPKTIGAILARERSA